MPAVGPAVAKAFKDVSDALQTLSTNYPVTPVTGPADNARWFFSTVTETSDLADTQKHFTGTIKSCFDGDWKTQGGAQEAAKLMVKMGKSFDQASMATKIQGDWDKMIQKVTSAAAVLENRLKQKQEA